MHELSIALSIVELATEAAQRLGSVQVTAVHLKLGQLSGVVREPLLFSYDLSCEGTSLQGSQLVIEEVPAMVYCSKCELKRTLASIQQISCPVCCTPTPTVIQGRELEIVALEIEDERDTSID